MALPKIFTKLFDNLGFGTKLRKDIIPNHGDTHAPDGSDPIIGLINKVIYIDEYTTINKTNISNVICSDRSSISIDSSEMTNGWNCYIKNIGKTNILDISCINNEKIDGNIVFKLSPLMTIHIFFDGATNFITLDTTPRITL